MPDDDSISQEQCGKCEKKIARQQKVHCDKCQTTFHGSCVKVNDNMLVCRCPVCDSRESDSLIPPPAPQSKRSRSHASRSSSKHTHSSKSSKAKAILTGYKEEQRLLEKQAEEKEALLKERHEQQMEILKKRQSILIEMSSSSSTSSKTSLKLPSVSSQEKVKSWIQATQLHQANDNDVSVAHKIGAKFVLEEMYSSTQLPRTNANRTNIPVHTIISEPATYLQRTCDAYPSTTKATFNSSTRPQTVNSVGMLEERKGLSREEIAARHIMKELPKFDGSPKLWPRFLSCFHRSTKVCGFSNFENLERLNQSLTGDAYNAVESSLMMEENVPKIMETLELLYGKPEFIISNLLEELRKSPSPALENIDSILKYSLDIENISSTMVNAKLAEHLWNPLLLNEMVDRLPIQLKLEWASYKYINSPCSIEVFSLWLKSKAVTYTSILTKPPKLKSGQKRENKHSVNIHQPMSKIKCLVCLNNCEAISSCEKFKALPVSSKWDTVRRLQVCRICLSKHRGKRCNEDSVCGIDGCQFRHNKLLHNKKEIADSTDAKESNVPALNVHVGEKTYFKILPVYLTNGNKKLMIYAMLDDGSSLTLMDRSISNLLGLVGEHQPLCLRWTNGVEHRDELSKVVSFEIAQYSNSKSYKLENVHTIENLQLPCQSVNMEQLTSSYHHLKNINITSFENAKPLLLIGLNHSKLMEVTKYRFGNVDEPAAAKTPLGWCVFGSISTRSEVLHINKCDCEKNSNSRLEKLVRDNYCLDAIGISNPSSLPKAKSEELAFEILNKTTKLCDRRFQVGLLWKYKEIHLPNSLPMAKRRLQCLENKIKVEPQLRSIINNKLEEYISKGYAIKLDQRALQENNCWYLPIFVVRNSNKPNKIRLVWDGAASANGVSLNDVLLKGPDLLSSLPGVLLRFREYEVAVTGDIQEMFHQVSIRPSDRRYQRFIWRQKEEEEIQVYEMCVMTFGASCSPSSSQFIKNLNADRFKDQFPLAVEAIKTNHYVDDWLQSVATADEAVVLAKQVRQVHNEGGFKIHKWISNAASVVRSLENVPEAVEKSMELSPTFDADKVLGMFWATLTDTFHFKLRVDKSNQMLISGESIPSKRQVLKFLMSIFDPLGLITPILIYPKILLQMIWRSNKGWDEIINLEQQKQWLSWVKSLDCLNNISIPRWIGFTKNCNFQIEVHTFVDASEDAFAAAVYFKITTVAGIKCSLISSKSRVAPLRSLSIPRLELQAAVLGARLAKFVTTSSSPCHDFHKRYFWTDSETVMKWLYSDSRRYTQYVSCRIGEILENSSLSEWNWLTGKQNVADMGTKMRLFDEFQLDSWFQGPSFLYGREYPL